MGKKKVAVIGAGTMGHGIAQLFAARGFEVALSDTNSKVLEKALPRIQANLRTCVEHGVIGDEVALRAPERITLHRDTSAAVAGADLVIEAVVENLDVKHEVLRRIEAVCGEETIIASNTSSFRVGDMAPVLRAPERFLITHFWNPPYIVPLVEVVRGEQTSTEAIETTCFVLRDAGKYPVVVQKDVPGFIGNRLQHALRREAIAIVAQGIASAEDVDFVARMSFGLRLPIIGPLETVDLSGLDLTLAIQSYLLRELDRSTEPTQLVRDKVARGELGAKAGKGFFDWPAGRYEEAIRKRDESLLELVKWLREHDYLDIDPE